MKKSPMLRRTHYKTSLVAIACVVAFGQARAQWDAYQAPQQSFLEKFVLPMAGAALGGLAGSVIQHVGGKLISAFMAPEKGTMVQPPPAGQIPCCVNQQPVQFNIAANTAGMMPAVFQPAPPPITPTVSAVAGVMYAIDRLNNDYSLRETITPQAGVSPTFQSREKFAIRYTSNQPGVVVIMNVDAQQKTFYLGTFVVAAGADFRFPQQTNKAMVLDDNVGLETYQMLFMACLPPQMANQPDVVARKWQIPECGPTAQAEQTILAAQKGRRSKGTYSEALQQADGTSNVVMSYAPYQKGDVTTTTFTINHVPPLTQPQGLQLVPQSPTQSPSDITGII